jgi:hypothetical protein
LAALESEHESLILELVDPELETVALGPKIAGVVMHYNCKDSDTHGVA